MAMYKLITLKMAILLAVLPMSIFSQDIENKKFNGVTIDGFLLDIDGNSYPIKTYGEQTWMLTNLITSKYNDGTIIPEETKAKKWTKLSTGARCFPDFYIEFVDCSSCLYNWFAVESGMLCPKGWRVPSDEDWTVFENYLIAQGYNYDGSTSGNKLAKSLAHILAWKDGRYVGTPGNTDYPEKRNATGFSALPVGFRSFQTGELLFTRYCSRWWSSSESDSNRSFSRLLSDAFVDLKRDAIDKRMGTGVRCVK